MEWVSNPGQWVANVRSLSQLSSVGSSSSVVDQDLVVDTSYFFSVTKLCNKSKIRRRVNILNPITCVFAHVRQRLITCAQVLRMKPNY